MLTRKLKTLIYRVWILAGLSLFFLSLNLFGNVSQNAYACSGQTTTADWKKPTVKERVEVAHTVLEGTVVQVVSGYIVVEVQRYFKNPGPDKVKIAGFWTSASASGGVCSTRVELGQHAIFFVRSQQDDTLYVRTEFPLLEIGGIGYDPTEAVTPDFVNTLLVAGNPKPVLPNPPSVNRAGTTNQPTLSQSIVLIMKFWQEQIKRVRS